MLKTTRRMRTGLGVWAIIFLTVLAVAPYGCSQGDKSAEGSKVGAAGSKDPARAHFDEGVQLALIGRYDEAIGHYQKSIKHNPDSAATYNNLGFAYLDKGELDLAIDNQVKALELAPKMANAYYGLALALERQGDTEGAIENWEDFLKYAKPHSTWWNKANESLERLKGNG